MSLRWKERRRVALAIRSARSQAAARRACLSGGPRRSVAERRGLECLQALRAYVAGQQASQLAGRCVPTVIVTDVTPPCEPSDIALAEDLARDASTECFDPFDDPQAQAELDQQARRQRYGRDLELAHVIREFGQQYLAGARRDGVPPDVLARHERILRSLMGCRTSAMGDHRWQCGNCGRQYQFFNSCGDRHCNKCGEAQRRRWAHKLEQDLLPVTYHHVILTLPHELTLLVMDHGGVLYSRMMRAAGRAILDVGRELLNAQLAVQLLLHTWGQLVNDHVHFHGVVPGGGMPYGDPEKAWEGFPKKDEFLSLERLAELFRDRVIAELLEAHASGELQLAGRWRRFESPEAFRAMLEPFRSIDWVVRHRSVWVPHNQPEEIRYRHVINYLANYANRVVIGNSRLEQIAGDEVWFRYKDYRDGNRWKTTAIDGVEFLGKFLRHTLPPGLHNKRRFGFWGYSVRTKNLKRIRAEMGVSTPPEETSRERAAEEKDSHQEREPRVRYCLVCDGELQDTGGTFRPTIPVILDMIWEDMQKALDAYPASYPVRTHLDVYLEPFRVRFQAFMESRRMDTRESVPDDKEPSKAHPRRGPPPDPQKRLEFAST